MSDLNQDDYNGECFIVGASGEREEFRTNRVVHVPAGMPFSKTVNFNPANADHRNYLDLFYRLQYHVLVEAYVPMPNPAAVRQPDANLAERLRKIAYIRMLAARNGHYDYTGTAASHHTRYSEYNVHTWASLQTWARTYLANNTVVITDLATARTVIPQVPHHAADANWQNAYRHKYIDTVCVVAYFFRVRGHHWTDEMDSRYSDVWRKCLYQEDNPGISWQYIAHDALHAIFPDDLDDIWEAATDTEACAGTLIKRFDSLPAGVAGISALNAGVADLQMIVPKALDYSKDAMTHLENLTQSVEAHRWAGSVNRRFYNAPNLVVDEAKLSALAAIIRAGLEGLAPGSPLLKSKALQRIAQNAQMTGAIVGKMVMTAVKSDAAAEIFLPDIRHTNAP
jgi:hypothetical protein